MSDPGLFTLEDCIRAGYCPSGIKQWCKTRNFDARDFLSRLKVGIPLEEARSWGDGLIDRAIALKEETNGR